MNRWKKAAAVVLVILQLVLTGVALPSQAGPVVDAASRAVLTLEAFDAQDQFIGSGCGFVAFDDMSLVTNYGMIKGADWLIATDNNGSRYIVTHIIAADEKMDVAILELFSPTDIAPLKIGEREETPSTSSMVTAVQRRLWEDCTAVVGSIGKVYKTDDVSYFEYSAGEAVLPGSPLLSASGVVIGVHTGQAGEGANLALNFAQVVKLWEENLSVESKTFAAFFGREKADAFPFPLPDPDKVLSALPTPVPKDLLEVPHIAGVQWTASGMKITWAAASNAKQYTVYRSSQRDRGYMRIGDTQSTEFLDQGAGDKGWFYKVENQKADGATLTSAPMAGFPPLETTKDLSAPKGVKAKTAPDRVTVTFGAVKNAAWYVVYRSSQKNKGYEAVAQVAETTFVDRDVALSETYYYKISSVSGSHLSNQSAAAQAKMPKPTPTLKPTPTPYVEPEYFLQMGREARWAKKKGYWNVNPKVVNGSKTSTVDGFTLTYFCEDVYGDMIRRNGDGDYYVDAVYEKTLKPGKSTMPGYTWLEGYDDPAYIGVAITKIHTTDGRTIDIPREKWSVGYIQLN